MAGVTTPYNLPYLQLGDAPNIATGTQNLAEAVKTELARIDAAYLPKADVIRIRKAADQPVTNNAAIVPDTHLQFSALASRFYIVTAMLIVTQSANSTAADFKIGFSLPAGATWTGGAPNPDASIGTTAVGSGNWTAQFGAAAATLSYGLDGNAANFTALFLHATVAMSTTAGTVALAWAQNTATAITTTVKGGSYLKAELI